MTSNPETSSGGGTLGRLGERLLRHSATYAAGTGIELSFALVRVALLTRLLPIGEYGQLAVLMVYAGFVTIGCRMIAVTGTLLSVFRGGDEEGVDEDEDEDMPSDHEQRRLLGTGLMMALGLTLLLALASVAAAPTLEVALIEVRNASSIVVATLLGGLSAVLHLAASISRFERRPSTYVGLQVLNTVLGMAAAVALIEAGHGVIGAIGGFAIGAGASSVVAIFINRHRFSPALHPAHAVTIVKRGAPMAAITASFFVVRNVDLYMVARYLPVDDVALYRVASRVGNLSGAGVGALLLAWGPLIRGPIRGAMTRQGKVTEAGARLYYIYWLSAMVLVVALALLRGLLIKIAPPEYEDAAVLIPLLGLATLLSSGVVLAHRVGMHKRKRPLLASVGILMTLVIVGLSALLAPRYEFAGVIAAIVIAPVIGVSVILGFAQRADEPIPMRWGRIAAVTLAAGAWIGAFTAIAEWVGDPAGVVSIVGALGFAPAVVFLGVVERSEARSILRILRNAIPLGGRRELTDALSALPQEDRELLERLLGEEDGLEALASDLGIEERELRERLVALIRQIGALKPPGPIEDEIGAYLLAETNVNERDRIGHQLAMSEHLDPVELDQIAEMADRLRKAGGRRGSRRD